MYLYFNNPPDTVHKIEFNGTFAVVCFHVWKASAAAWIAVVVSDASISGTEPTTLPLAGSVTSKFLPLAAATHSPLIKALSRRSGIRVSSVCA
jgi:hypothetical protein